MHSVTPLKSTPQGCRHELKVWGLNFERVPGESPLEIHSSNCSDFSRSRYLGDHKFCGNEYIHKFHNS